MNNPVEWIKYRAEFFKGGSIIPQRVLKGSRKIKSKVKFGCDTYVIATENGYFALSLINKENYILNIGVKQQNITYRRRVNFKLKDFRLHGSVYFNGGRTTFYGVDSESNDELNEVISMINKINNNE